MPSNRSKILPPTTGPRGGWSGGHVPEPMISRPVALSVALVALVLAHAAIAYGLIFRR
jgi:hypothetical protein